MKLMGWQIDLDMNDESESVRLPLDIRWNCVSSSIVSRAAIKRVERPYKAFVKRDLVAVVVVDVACRYWRGAVTRIW